MSAEGSEPIGFDAIWQAIKGWDIQREHGAGYHGPTGDDVRTILAALSAAGYWVVPRDDLNRAKTLIGLLTVRQVIDAGDAAIDAAGLNPWCINEGLADGTETIRWGIFPSAAAEEPPHG